jgi:Xaa-Pro aminopeptidase
MLIVPAFESEFGKYLKLEPLTLCPIDKTPIDVSLLSEAEVQWLNNYHQLVYEKLSPLLDAEEQAWLREATAALSASFS